MLRTPIAEIDFGGGGPQARPAQYHANGAEEAVTGRDLVNGVKRALRGRGLLPSRPHLCVEAPERVGDPARGGARELAVEHLQLGQAPFKAVQSTELLRRESEQVEAHRSLPPLDLEY